MLPRIELTDVQNAPVANTASTTYFKLPDNLRIHLAWILLQLPAGKTLEELCQYIQLTIGSKESRQLTPVRWDELLTLDGPNYGLQGNVPGGLCYIPFQFTEPYREGARAKDNYALDLVSGVFAAIRLKFNANANQPAIVRAGAVVESLDRVRARGADQVNYDKDGRPFLAKYYEIGINPGGSNPDLDTQLDPITRGRLVSLSLYNPLTTGSVDRSVLKLSGSDAWDRYKADNDFELSYFGATPRAGRMDYIADIIDAQNDAVPMAKGAVKLRLESQAGMTGGMTAVAKVWGVAD